MERRISMGDSDGADGAGSKSGESAAGDKTKDGTSEDLKGGAESLTGSR